MGNHVKGPAPFSIRRPRIPHVTATFPDPQMDGFLVYFILDGPANVKAFLVVTHVWRWGEDS